MESRKLKGVYDLPKFIPNLTQSLVQTAIGGIAGVAEFIPLGVSSVIDAIGYELGITDEMSTGITGTRGKGFHYRRVDVLSDFISSITNYNIIGKTPYEMYGTPTPKIAPNFMAEFRSNFKGGKGANMITDMLPFTIYIMRSMKNPTAWQGAYSKGYKMLSNRFLG